VYGKDNAHNKKAPPKLDEANCYTVGIG